MKIAVNARLLHTDSIEGIGRYAVEVIKRISRDHPEDDIHLVFDHRPDPIFKFADNVYLHQVGWPARHPTLWRFWFEFSFRRFVNQLKPDVVFSPESYMSIGVNMPTVITTHDLAYLHYPKYNKKVHINYLKRWFPRFHESATSIICVSNYTRDDVIEQYGIERSKLKVIYNGVSQEGVEYSSEELDQFKHDHRLDRPYFLYLGAIHPRKNIVKLIEGFNYFKAMNGTEHILVLAGRLAWDFQDVSQAVAASAFKSDIRVLGYFEGNKDLLLKNAIALCYISLFEGFGLPLLEAMRVGTPVIASHVSALPEIGGDAALYITPTDIKGISEAMNQVVANEGLRHDLIEKGYERIKLFSWDTTAKKVYQALIEATNK